MTDSVQEMGRKYTLAEIDLMREMVHNELSPHDDDDWVGGGNHSAMDKLIYAQQNQVCEARVEQRLRTYIMASLGPEDLEHRKPDAPDVAKEFKAMTSCDAESPEKFGLARTRGIIAQANEMYAKRNGPLLSAAEFAAVDEKLNQWCRSFWPELVATIESLTTSPPEAQPELNRSEKQ